MAKLTFRHPKTGFTHVRQTIANYTHVSDKNGQIRWHQSEEAARRTGGQVFPVARETPPQKRTEAFAAGTVAGKSCTRGPSVGGGRCGKPAVSSFQGSDGETLYECKDCTPPSKR